MQHKTNRGPALLILAALTLTVTVSINGAKAWGQEVLYLVHYAERELGGSKLTDVGKEKAKALAQILIDAGIQVIYSAKPPHVVETAEPTAKALNIKINFVSLRTKDWEDLIRRLRTQHANDRVFIATGMDGMHQILRAFGFNDDDIYNTRTDNLFVIIPRSGSEPQVIKLRW